MEVVHLNAEYPCCGQRAKFSKAECSKFTVRRICDRCHTEWIVTRNRGRAFKSSRVDTLNWKER